VPFNRPSLDELRERIKQDLRNKLIGADPSLRVSNLRVFAEIEAGTVHLAFGRLDWNFKQLFPDTADADSLEHWCSIWNVRRSPATRAGGIARAVAEPGAAVPDGSLLSLAGNSAQLYRVRGGVNEAGGFVVVTIEADAYGPEGNQAAGTQLRWNTVIQGVAPVATVDPPGLVGGAPADTDEELLQALLMRIQQPPHGGNATDYVRWTLEVSGVTRAWCYPLERGLGTVVIRFMMDEVEANGARGPGIPSDADCNIVWDHLEVVRPVTADIGPDRSLQAPFPAPSPGTDWGHGYVFPPVPVAAPITIQGLTPDRPEIRAAIQIELLDMFRWETAPGESLWRESYVMAIGRAPGVERFRLVDPAADVVVQAGEIPIIGPVTYLP
jgi:uncharacterized phage protein gp47/JayE